MTTETFERAGTRELQPVKESANNSIAAIIAYYNGSAFVEEAIKSACTQTLPFDEIILVDDGSRADEADFAKTLAQQYQLKYIRQENGGQGSARNAGARASSAAYVSFLDQDDILLPEHNVILLKAIENQPVANRGTAYGNFAVANANGSIVSRKGRPARNIDRAEAGLYQFLQQDIFILPSASLIYRSALLAVNGFDEQFRGYEDDDLFIRLFRAGYLHSFTDEEVYIWRMHDNQTSSTHVMLESRVRFINKWLDNGYGRSVDASLIHQFLYERFKLTVLRDVARAKDQTSFMRARSIARDFSAKFDKNQRLIEKLAFVAFSLLPQEVLLPLLNTASAIRRKYRVLLSP